MSQTQTPPPGAPGPSVGPRVSGAQMRDVRRLRRSSTDRYVAGVAGGLGRHLDVDPTIIRVVLVVLALFGGAGLIIYGAVWLLVPEDDSERAPIDVNPDTRRVLLIVAAVVAALSFLGVAFSDHGWGWGFPVPVIVLAVVAIVVFATRDRRDRTPPPPWPGTPGAPTRPQAAMQEGSPVSTTTAPSGPPTAQPPTPAGPAYVPPTPGGFTPPPPPRPRRTGMILFWPTLALIAIALGTLGVVDAGYDVPFSAYPALALTVVGVMLLVGAFVGRPGGLIALGLLAALITGIFGAVEATGGPDATNRSQHIAPRTALAVQDGYTLGRGELTLDLTRVRDVAALGGRDVHVDMQAGRIHVIVPDDLDVNVRANVSYGGQITVGDELRSGWNPSLDTTLDSPTGEQELDLRLNLNVGEIFVDQR